MTNPWMRTGRPLIIAHRGHCVDVPENTLPAYEMALQLGANMIEADVNISKDGTLVMVHDHVLGRTTDLRGPVHEYALEDLLKADAGSWLSAEFKGVRMPTTAEALEFAKQTGIYMCFEVKGGEPVQARTIAEKLVDLFARYDAFDWAFMSSYHHEALATAKRKAPQLMLAPERIPDNVEPDIEEALRQVHSLGSDVLQIHYQYLYPEVMEAMRAANIALWAWPTTLEDEILLALRSNADGLMGDDVRLAVQLTDQFYPPGEGRDL